MYFTFKGENSYDYGITVVGKVPFLTAPFRTYQEQFIGKDGAYIELHGFTPYVANIDLVIDGADNIFKIKSWLSGEGQLTRSDYPNKYLNVDFQSELEFVYKAQGLYTCALSIYIKDPFWYNVDRQSLVSDNIITNNGTIRSTPIYKFTRTTSDIIDVTIGNSRFIYDFKGESHVYIDTRDKISYYGHRKGSIPQRPRIVNTTTTSIMAISPDVVEYESSRDSQLIIGNNYPYLEVGENKVIFNSGTCKIEIIDKDRWV